MAAGRAPHRMAAYVDGNTVRRAEPEVRRERRERPRRQESTPYLKEQIRRNQERALSMDLPYVMMLSAAAVWSQIQAGLLGMVLQAMLVPVIVMGLRALLLRDKE